MSVIGKLPSLTPTQAYFCRVMLRRGRAKEPSLHALELAAKFDVSHNTIRNQAVCKHTKHYDFSERLWHEARA